MVLLFYCFVVAVALVVSAFENEEDLILFINRGFHQKKQQKKTHLKQEEEEEENGTHVQ